VARIKQSVYYIYDDDTYMWNKVKKGVANQRSDTKTEHSVDDVVVDGPLTKPDDQQSAQRDDGDDEYRNCSVAVHCIYTHSNRFTQNVAYLAIFIQQ